MSVKDYKQVAISAIGLVSSGEALGLSMDQNGEMENQTEPEKIHHNLGGIRPENSLAMTTAMINQRNLICANVYMKYCGNMVENNSYTDHQRNQTISIVEPIISTNEIITYKRYLEVLKERKSIINQADKIKVANDNYMQILKGSKGQNETWQQHSHRWKDAKKKALNIRPPEMMELELAEHYSPDIFTADLKGYINYIKRLRPDFYTAVMLLPLDVALPETDRIRHSYITGGSGSGKSELLKQIVFSYLSDFPNYSALILVEPHGDLAKEICRWSYFKSNPNKLVYIDPNLEKGYTPSFNPLTLPNSINPDVYAQQLVSVFEQLLDGDGGNTLTVNMRALLLPCLKVLLKMNGATLLDLQRFMAKDERATKYIELGKQDTNMQTAEFFKHEFNDNKWTVTKGSISTKIVSLLNTETEQRMFLRPSTFDLESIINNKQTLLLRFSKGEVGDLSAKTFGRFIVATLQSIALRRAAEEKEDRVPIHLILDECQNYITKDIEGVLQESRKYKLYLTMAQQIFGMGMGNDLKNIVLGNTKVKMCGQNGHHETQQKMATSMKVNMNQFDDLEVGQFVAKSGENEAFTLNVNPMLAMADENSAINQTAEEWQETVKHQLAHYYGKDDNQVMPQQASPPADDDVQNVLDELR